MAIIFGGFIIVMVQNVWVGQYIQNKNHVVTEFFFPAALHAQETLTAFQAQLEEFEEAVLSAEPERLKTAVDHTENIIMGLERITTIAELPAVLTSQAAEDLSRYRRFAREAFPLYSRMLDPAPNETLLERAAELDRLSHGLINSLTFLADSMSQIVGEELQNITTLSQRQNKTNLLVFLTVLVISSILVAHILLNSIIKPLQKTVALANMMAAGDLSQKLDIKHNDEIGALGHAMNTMARQLENHYQELEAAVNDKTHILQKANKQLQIEIEQRHDTQHELLAAMEKAEDANRTKSSFLAMMSHELRTPMNGIIGMSSLVLDTALDETQRRYLTTIRNSAEALLTILNDILDFSKIEADKLELETVDFEPHKVMDDISEHLSGQAHDMGLEFFTLTDPSVPDWLQGDAGRLRQVLLSLGDNAIKFTKSGEVAIRMEVIDRTAKDVTIRFAISDTGIGIPAGQLQHLFEPFTQADISTTRKFGGTGLGLAISNRLVQLMGGIIKAESSEGKGSTFWFTATFAISDHASPAMAAPKIRSLIYNDNTPPSPPPPPFLATGKRILVADDETTNLIVAQAILESFGCIVHLAHTGQEAVDQLQQRDYDLILMDIQMPVLDGLMATATIKGWSQSAETTKQAKSRIPIIAITADASKENVLEYFTAGIADHIEKPLRPASLADCLRKWLPARQRQQNERQPPLQFSEKRLLLRLKGDVHKLKELIMAARIAIPRHLAELDLACTNNDCRQAIKTCLAIKKIGGNLGVAALQHHAIQLCLAMESNDEEQAREHYRKIKPLLTELLQRLGKNS